MPDPADLAADRVPIRSPPFPPLPPPLPCDLLGSERDCEGFARCRWRKGEWRLGVWSQSECTPGERPLAPLPPPPAFPPPAPSECLAKVEMSGRRRFSGALGVGRYDGCLLANESGADSPREEERVACVGRYVDPTKAPPEGSAYPADCSFGCALCVYRQHARSRRWRCMQSSVMTPALPPCTPPTPAPPPFAPAARPSLAASWRGVPMPLLAGAGAVLAICWYAAACWCVKAGRRMDEVRARKPHRLVEAAREPSPTREGGGQAGGGKAGGAGGREGEQEASGEAARAPNGFGSGGPAIGGVRTRAVASPVVEGADAPLRAEPESSSMSSSSAHKVQMALQRRLGPSPSLSEEAPNALQSLVKILSPTSRTNDAASPVPMRLPVIGADGIARSNSFRGMDEL